MPDQKELQKKKNIYFIDLIGTVATQWFIPVVHTAPSTIHMYHRLYQVLNQFRKLKKKKTYLDCLYTKGTRKNVQSLKQTGPPLPINGHLLLKTLNVRKS